MTEKRKKYYTLKGVGNKLLEATTKIADELAANPKINKDTVAYMEQLNTLIEKVLLIRGMPTVIKKDIKETIKKQEEENTKIDVNSVLDVYAKQDE